jgi:hypothetical protein
MLRPCVLRCLALLCAALHLVASQPGGGGGGGGGTTCTAPTTTSTRFTFSGGSIGVSTTGVPFHKTGPFPNSNNPNSVCSQTYTKSFANRGGSNVAATTHAGELALPLPLLTEFCSAG